MSKVESDLIDSLIAQFDPDKFIIKIDKNNIEILSIETNDFCTAMTINHDKKEIAISALDKCSIPGSETLKRIENFAKSMGIRKISLGDASELDFGCVKINLAVFHILHSNWSWYNSKGYVSFGFEREKLHNVKLLKMEIKAFLTYCFDEMPDEDHIWTDNRNKLINGIKYFSEDDTIMTHEFFYIAKESLRKEENICDLSIDDRQKYMWLAYSVDVVARSGKIRYDNNLSKLLKTNGGAKTRKMSKRPRKTNNKKTK
jgi:hypothetical protein